MNRLQWRFHGSFHESYTIENAIGLPWHCLDTAIELYHGAAKTLPWYCCHETAVRCHEVQSGDSLSPHGSATKRVPLKGHACAIKCHEVACQSHDSPMPCSRQPDGSPVAFQCIGLTALPWQPRHAAPWRRQRYVSSYSHGSPMAVTWQSYGTHGSIVSFHERP